MPAPSIEVLRRYLRRLCDEAAPAEDAELLNRFVTANDRQAFELLVARHGPMVLGTARRLLGNGHDAEDVFQAVFLSLARLAKSIRHGRALPAWLHRTTCRIAARLRADRPPQSTSPPEPSEQGDPAAGLVWREVCEALDEELQRLPERLRSPLLLCYLSGLARDEAARQLGWSLGTLKRRLEQGRNALRVRLTRRGIAPVGLALAVLSPEALRAEVARPLLDGCLRLVFSSAPAVPAAISALVVGPAGTAKSLAVKSALALLAAVALGVGIYAGGGPRRPAKEAEGGGEEAKPATEDRAVKRDDPLPAGSTLRFGTSRFRYGIPVSTLAVSADGKLAVAANGGHKFGSARAFDLASGRVVYTLERSSQAAAISPDGRTVVTREDISLCVWDAATGKGLREIMLPPAGNNYSRNEWVAFTPDGKAVAVTSRGDVIHLIDFASGKTIRDFSNRNPESSLGPGWESVLGVAFSPDGKRMASGGFVNDHGNYFARLWDVETGKELRRFMHGKTSYGIPSLAFSPDGKTLATRAHDGRMRLFDVDSGKLRKTFRADGGGRRLGTVAFSPDGKTVAAAGDAIRLYDVTTGEERLWIDRKQATGLRFTDGGKTLTGAVKGAIYRWDAATGKALTPEAAGDSPVEQVLVSPDGRRVVTRGQDGDAHLWDGSDGRHLRALSAAWQRGMAMSPDGRFLVWPAVDASIKFRSPGVIHDGSRLRLYDIAADRFVDRFPGFKGDADDLTFTDEGKQLVAVDRRDGTVRLWDVATGKELRSFQAVPEVEKGHEHHVGRAALSPDGKTLAVAYTPVATGRGLGRLGGDYVVRLWDVAAGKELCQLGGHHSYVVGMVFSPDGRLLATADETSVFVWDVATGQRVAVLPGGQRTGADAVAFSRDGGLLATALPDGTIRLWEVASWATWHEYKGHRDRVTVLTFAPGGRLLSGSVDTTVLAWNLRPPRVAGPAPLDRAWDDLAAKEASRAFRAEGTFLAAPAEAVRRFDDKIRPPEALDPVRVRRWLAELDSGEFAVREAAAKALQRLDERAVPYLEETLRQSGSAEVRARVASLLKQKKRLVAPPPEQLRQLRAVMVLEWIGDDAAKGLLKRWAGGPAGARLTTEAAAALRRLEGADR